MGYQTTLIIRNDGIGDIRDNPEEFVRNMLTAMDVVATGLEPHGSDFGCGTHANPARVIEVHHSDSTTIIASGGGSATFLATMPRWKFAHMRNLLEVAGQTLLARGRTEFEAD